MCSQSDLSLQQFTANFKKPIVLYPLTKSTLTQECRYVICMQVREEIIKFLKMHAKLKTLTKKIVQSSWHGMSSNKESVRIAPNFLLNFHCDPGIEMHRCLGRIICKFEWRRHVPWPLENVGFFAWDKTCSLLGSTWLHGFCTRMSD